MHAIARRDHLQLHRDQAQLFDGARTANAAVADKGGRLPAKLIVGVVERILQRAGDAAVVLGDDKNEAVELGELGAPAAGNLVLRRAVGR